MPISLRPWVSVMPPQPRSMEARLGEQPLWGRHCEPLLKRASLTCWRPAISVRRMLRHSLSTSGTISGNWAPSLICTQPPCARGPRAQWTLWAGSLSTVRTLCKDYRRFHTPNGPPTHRWGILAAMELHASLYGTMVSYEDLPRRMVCPLEWICRSIRIMRLCKSFMTNGGLICNRAIRARAQCWHGRPVRPHHRASCCGSPINGSLIKKATRFFGDLFGRPFLPAFFCQHPLMATLDMHGELCTWRLFTLRRHPGVPTPLRALPMERC